MRALQALDRGAMEVHGEGHSTEQTKARLEAKIRELDADVLERRWRSAQNSGAPKVVPIRHHHKRRRMI